MNTVMPYTIGKYFSVYNIGIHIKGMSWLFNYLTATTFRQPIKGNEQAAQMGRLILQKEGLHDSIPEYLKNQW